MASELGIPICGPMPQGTAYATPIVRNYRVCWAFSGTATESLIYWGTLPVGYDGGGITVDIYAHALSATSGGYVWSVAFERGNTDIDLTNEFATAKTVTATTNGTAGIETIASIVFDNTEIDGLVAGEDFYLLLKRVHDAAGDDITTDVQLRGISLRET